MKALLKLPETWHVVVNNENRELLEQWKFGKINTKLMKDGWVVGMYKWKSKNIEKEYNHKYENGYGQEITTADFKRLVLGEKNFEDYGVIGCEELKEYFLNKKICLTGVYKNKFYFYRKNSWDYIAVIDCLKQELPLSEYLKLLPTETEPTETGSTEPEVIETEVKIKKTWETIYFETKNASIELTLNHDEKTFNLSTKYEGNVSFKKDTIESAMEKLKCIEYALNYVEQNLKKK